MTVEQTITVNEAELTEVLQRHYAKQIDVGAPFAHDDVLVDWSDFIGNAADRRSLTIKVQVQR